MLDQWWRFTQLTSAERKIKNSLKNHSDQNKNTDHAHTMSALQRQDHKVHDQELEIAYRYPYIKTQEYKNINVLLTHSNTLLAYTPPFFPAI